MMGAGILMSIIKTLVLLAKRLIFGCSGFLAPAWFSGGGLCKAGRIPFFGIHECCIFAVCYSGGRSSVGISCRTWNWKRVPFHIDISPLSWTDGTPAIIELLVLWLRLLFTRWWWDFSGMVFWHTITYYDKSDARITEVNWVSFLVYWLVCT